MPVVQTIANGQYLAGTQTVKGDPNLTPANIRKGVTLFEVDGAMRTGNRPYCARAPLLKSESPQMEFHFFAINFL